MNPRKTVIAAIMLFALLFALFAFAAFSKSEPSVSARSAVLYEPTRNNFLYAHNENERLPMASTTKIMTALTALRACDSPDTEITLDTEITIDKRAVGIEGSSAYFRGGEVYTLFDLLHILMLRSANDAAMQIAYTVSGEVSAFAALMNEVAADLGLTDTHFENPSGLDSENHYTTARELAVIAAEAMKYEVFRDIVAKRVYTATDRACGENHVFANHNKLLTLYDGCVGVKTGYTKRSGRSLVSAACRDGVTLIAVTINAPCDWSDHQRMLDFGFSRVESCEALSADTSFELGTVNSDTSSVRVRVREAFSFVRERGEETELIYDLPKYLIAPIKAGDAVGSVKIISGGKVVGEVDIIAECDVPGRKSFFEKLF